MGWYKGGRYYTRSCRVDGRVARQYVGGGEVGRLAAEMGIILREGRRLAEDKKRRRRAREDKAQSLLDKVAKGAALVYRAGRVV